MRRSSSLGAIAVTILCAVLVSRPAFALLELRQGQLADDGTPVLIRAAMYYQPHAFHHYFWTELDESIVEPDLEQMKSQGLNTIILQVNWGDFMPAVDVEAETFTWNADAERKLLHILTLADEKDMYVILWFTWARAPEGVGAKLNEAREDLGGRQHPPFYGYLLRNYPALAINNTFAWKACLTFHERIAALTADAEHVILDPLDWQHLNMDHWAWADAENLDAWRGYLRRINDDLAHWNERWDEENADWDQVLLPVDSHVQNTVARLPESPYAERPLDPYGTHKWHVFNNWHNAAFVRVARQILQVLEAAAPRALIGQRIDRWRYGQWRPETWAPWHPGDKLAPLSNRFFFITHYPKTREDAEQVHTKLAESLGRIRGLDEISYPIMIWETGIDVAAFYLDEDAETRETAQYEHLDAVASTVEALDLLGFGWWVWRDYYMSTAAQQYGLVRFDGAERKAVELLKWAYGPDAEPGREPGKQPSKKKPKRRRN